MAFLPKKYLHWSSGLIHLPIRKSVDEIVSSTSGNARQEDNCLRLKMLVQKNLSLGESILEMQIRAK